MKEELFVHGDRAAILKHALQLEYENEVLRDNVLKLAESVEDYKAGFKDMESKVEWMVKELRKIR